MDCFVAALLAITTLIDRRAGPISATPPLRARARRNCKHANVALRAAVLASRFSTEDIIMGFRLRAIIPPVTLFLTFLFPSVATVPEKIYSTADMSRQSATLFPITA
jgi:hypothetical protein